MFGKKELNTIVLQVEGMACPMCEAHMNDVIRKTYPDAKKVKSSHKKGETVFLSEEIPDEEKLGHAIEKIGYELKAMTVKK
jgi:copper chaperone CopZ